MSRRHLHILGIAGTAMAGLASLARQTGWHVTGSDKGVYPPMSLFLERLGISVAKEYSAKNLTPEPDLVLVGNAVSRGNPEVEALLNSFIPYRSGPEWLSQHVLEKRHPIVVTGTHGKTTTSSMIAWILETAGEAPGFLIGGIPLNFGESARFPSGQIPWIVVEGDEYDTAFFDKRAKFLHYRPRTLVIHNMEYDHADIYSNLDAIRRSFQLLLRTLPSSGQLLIYGDDPNLEKLVKDASRPVRVLRYGWRNRGHYDFSATLDRKDGRRWTLFQNQKKLFEVEWPLIGWHNVLNGLAAAATALSLGISRESVQIGLKRFLGAARRMQRRFETNGITLYEDFAHHPTAIAAAVSSLRAHLPKKSRLWAVLIPGSNTMRRRVHQNHLADALIDADRVVLIPPASRGLKLEEHLDVHEIASQSTTEADVVSLDNLVKFLADHLVPGDTVLVMNNQGVEAICGPLQEALKRQTAQSG